MKIPRGAAWAVCRIVDKKIEVLELFKAKQRPEADAALAKLRNPLTPPEKWQYALLPFSKKQALLPPGTRVDT